MCQAQRQVCMGGCSLPFLTNSLSAWQDKKALPCTWTPFLVLPEAHERGSPFLLSTRCLGWASRGRPFPGRPTFWKISASPGAQGRPQFASFRFSLATLADHSPLLTLTLLCALPRGQPG